MSNEIAVSKDFQTRIFERIRESMGDLLTDEELKKVLETAMNKALFEPEIVRDSYGRVSSNEASVLVRLIKDELTPRVAESVGAYMREHADEVTRAIDTAIAKGFFGLAQQHIENRIQQPLYDFANRLQQAGVLK